MFEGIRQDLVPAGLYCANRSILEHDYAQTLPALCELNPPPIQSTLNVSNMTPNVNSMATEVMLKEKMQISMQMKKKDLKLKEKLKLKKKKKEMKRKLMKQMKEKMQKKREDFERKEKEIKEKNHEQIVDGRFYAGYVPMEKTNEDLVQIKAGHAAVMLRIENFQAHKRDYINSLNIREFCAYTYKNRGQECARTDSIVVRRPDGKSHIKVYRVFNKWGPQTRGVDPGSIPHPDPPDPYLRLIEERKEAMRERFCGKCGNSTENNVPYSLAERMGNAEVHLNIDGPVPLDIYSRVKRIEDRILNLEAVSPEYVLDKNVVTKCKDDQMMDFVPVNKRSYSKYELKKRLALLKNKLPSNYRDLLKKHAEKMERKRKKSGKRRVKKMK